MKFDPTIIKQMQECEQSRAQLRDDLKTIPPEFLFRCVDLAKTMQLRYEMPEMCIIGTIAMSHFSDVLGEMYVEGKLTEPK